MKILVCVKQVPDTNEVKIDPVKGTLIRDGVPSILNPDDANALEAALQMKDKDPETKIAVITMGPPQATYMLRECMAMGADEAYLLSDRAFGGADTCATSTTIAAGIKKVPDVDIIFAGRQAIDGDTAQVGHQVAEKLNIPQITYAEEVTEIKDGAITIKRRIEKGIEVVKAKFPVLITVNGTAKECRPRNAKLLQKYKHAKTISEQINLDEDYLNLYSIRPELVLPEWNTKDVDANLVECGLSGSPTKVKKIENIVFHAKESKRIGSSDAEIEELIVELITNHTIG